jgi:hypothetical protein
MIERPSFASSNLGVGNPIIKSTPPRGKYLFRRIAQILKRIKVCICGATGFAADLPWAELVADQPVREFMQ